MCPLEVEPNSDFVSNPEGQTLLRPQPKGRAVERDHNLKFASDPFVGLNPGRDGLHIACVSQRQSSRPGYNTNSPGNFWPKRTIFYKRRSDPINEIRTCGSFIKQKPGPRRPLLLRVGILVEIGVSDRASPRVLVSIEALALTPAFPVSASP